MYDPVKRTRFAGPADRCVLFWRRSWHPGQLARLVIRVAPYQGRPRSVRPSIAGAATLAATTSQTPSTMALSAKGTSCVELGWPHEQARHGAASWGWSAAVLCQGTTYGQTTHAVDVGNLQRWLGGGLSLLEPVLPVCWRSMGRRPRDAAAHEKATRRVTTPRFRACGDGISRRGNGMNL